MSLGKEKNSSAQKIHAQRFPSALVSHNIHVFSKLKKKSVSEKKICVPKLKKNASIQKLFAFIMLKFAFKLILMENAYKLNKTVRPSFTPV